MLQFAPQIAKIVLSYTVGSLDLYGSTDFVMALIILCWYYCGLGTLQYSIVYG